MVRGELIFSSPIEEVDWEEVYAAGCNIPAAVRLGRKLEKYGIELSSDKIPYTVPGLVEALRK
jgi:hypothetical protein